MKVWKNKTPEQILSAWMLIVCATVMLFCAIVRISGGLWFTADLGSVPIPSQFWQEFITACLFAFEMVFVYKILCRCNWIIAIIISVLHTTVMAFIPTQLWTNIFNIIAVFIVPMVYTKRTKTFFDSLFLYAIELIYSTIFLVGRIGDLSVDANSNFVYGVLGAIDFKLFIVAIYLYTKNYEGVKLWSKQKFVILQTDIRKSETLL